MSALYVRQLAATWAQGLALPYFNTVNEAQDVGATEWFTLEYRAFQSVPLTFCSEQETGQIVMVFFGPAGVGFADLMGQAEPVVNAFFANVDPAGRLTLESIDSPSDDGIIDAPFYAVEYPLSYTFR